mmetsp:Transcript_14371/g.36721  ORF Transcript_14371/g.36721 Transcript_14371/m.36721 type:complete len:221 (-) Transcript_14371:245-907(-)
MPDRLGVAAAGAPYPWAACPWAAEPSAADSWTADPWAADPWAADPWVADPWAADPWTHMTSAPATGHHTAVTSPSAAGPAVWMALCGSRARAPSASHVHRHGPANVPPTCHSGRHLLGCRRPVAAPHKSERHRTYSPWLAGALLPRRPVSQAWRGAAGSAPRTGGRTTGWRTGCRSATAPAAAADLPSGSPLRGRGCRFSSGTARPACGSCGAQPARSPR